MRGIWESVGGGLTVTVISLYKLFIRVLLLFFFNRTSSHPNRISIKQIKRFKITKGPEKKSDKGGRRENGKWRFKSVACAQKNEWGTEKTAAQKG